jgi:glutamyl-tRNA synthetase
MKEAPRVRFAPSPTGHLHVGGARTALFNWLYARARGGSFVLRIEDTDRERSSDEMTVAILEGMRWLGLDWDEGPYHQADGFERHREEAMRILESGRAYRCFCTADELQARREARQSTAERAASRCCAAVDPAEGARRVEAGEPFTVRFRVPEGETVWEDLVHGSTRFRNEDIEDFIILRSDGTPIYNLAVVSDDAEMRITHVLRGDDHLSNTPKQILLYEALGARVPEFGHLPMILGPDGKRLSKRHGATSVGEYRVQGILPEALVNFLALLGWSPGEDREVLTVPDLISLFSTERILKKSSVFDPTKLLWMNNQHLQRTEASELLRPVAERLVDRGWLAPTDVAERHDWLVRLVDLLKIRSRTLDELVEQARAFLSPGVEYDEAGVAKHWADVDDTDRRLGVLHEALASLPEWEPAALEGALRTVAEELGTGFGKVVHPLRLAVTGSTASPGIDAVLHLLGRDETLRRIEAARRHLRRGRPNGVVDTPPRDG